MRFSIRRLMIGVAILALGFAAYRPAIGVYRYVVEWSYSTHYGWNTSVLPIGLKVQIVEDAASGGATIPAGTPGIVVSDPPDEDSAYDYRLVGVRITKGPRSGTVIDVKRTSLRAL